MGPVPFPGFRAFPTLHCVTGSMRHIYDLCGRDLGEELLLGLGAGVGFVYWHQKGAPPLLGGRGNVSRPRKEGFEIDRDEQVHPVALDVLGQARASRFPPFPPQHGHWRFDFTHQRAPRPGEVRAAIAEGAAGMLNPPIRSLGVAGIRRAADLIPAWPERLEPDELRAACHNGFILIDATGGTGGGIFRYMYGRFLEQAVELTGEVGLHAVAESFREAGDRWQDVALLLREAAGLDKPAEALPRISAMLRPIAELEESMWTRLATEIR